MFVRSSAFEGSDRSIAVSISLATPNGKSQNRPFLNEYVVGQKNPWVSEKKRR